MSSTAANQLQSNINIVRSSTTNLNENSNPFIKQVKQQNDQTLDNLRASTTSSTLNNNQTLNYLNPIPNPHNLDLGLDQHGHYQFNGTPMLSRAGQSTIPQYLCFQTNNPDTKQGKISNRLGSSDQIKMYEYDSERLDLTAFKKEYDEIQEKQQKLVVDKESKTVNVKNSVSRSKWLWKLRLSTKSNTSSFLTFNRNDSAIYKNQDKTASNQMGSGNAQFLGSLYLPKPLDDYNYKSNTAGGSISTFNQNKNTHDRQRRYNSMNSPLDRKSNRNSLRPKTANAGSLLQSEQICNRFQQQQQNFEESGQYAFQKRNSQKRINLMHYNQRQQSTDYQQPNQQMFSLSNKQTNVINQQAQSDQTQYPRQLSQISSQQQQQQQQLQINQQNQQQFTTLTNNSFAGNLSQQKIMTNNHNNDVLYQIERNKIKAPSIDKFTNREKCMHAKKLSQPQGPHELRFVSFNTINTNCTKYSDPNTYPPFDKLLSRQQILEKEQRLQNKTLYLHDYDPDFEKVKSKICVNIPDFKRQQGRAQSANIRNKPPYDPNNSSIDPVIVENSYKLLSHVKKDMCVIIDKSRGRNEEKGGIYQEKDKQVLIKRQYETFQRAFKQAASSSIKRHVENNQKTQSQFGSVLGQASPVKPQKPNFDIEYYEDQISQQNMIQSSLSNSPMKYKSKLHREQSSNLNSLYQSPTRLNQNRSTKFTQEDEEEIDIQNADQQQKANININNNSQNLNDIDNIKVEDNYSITQQNNHQQFAGNDDYQINLMGTYNAKLQQQMKIKQQIQNKANSQKKKLNNSYQQYTQMSLGGKERDNQKQSQEKQQQYFNTLTKNSLIGKSLMMGGTINNNKGDEVHLKMYQKAQKILKATEQIEQMKMKQLQSTKFKSKGSVNRSIY
eukprot:403359354